MELKERLQGQLAQYEATADEYRSLAEQNYGAAEALRRLISELESEQAEEIEHVEES